MTSESNIMRWYRSGTGRYTQSDPILARSKTTEPYAYAGSRPVVRIDRFGLYWANPTDFDDNQLQQIHSAMTKLKERLADECPRCVTKEIEDYFVALIDSPELHIVFRPDSDVCAANFHGTKVIELSPFAFDPSECCSLASVFAHELAHIAWPDNHQAADVIGKDCFGCYSSH